jgi:hypothetical protein
MMLYELIDKIDKYLNTELTNYNPGFQHHNNMNSPETTKDEQLKMERLTILLNTVNKMKSKYLQQRETIIEELDNSEPDSHLIVKKLDEEFNKVDNTNNEADNINVDNNINLEYPYKDQTEISPNDNFIDVKNPMRETTVTPIETSISAHDNNESSSTKEDEGNGEYEIFTFYPNTDESPPKDPMSPNISTVSKIKKKEALDILSILQAFNKQMEKETAKLSDPEDMYNNLTPLAKSQDGEKFLNNLNAWLDEMQVHTPQIEGVDSVNSTPHIKRSESSKPIKMNELNAECKLLLEQFEELLSSMQQT